MDSQADANGGFIPVKSRSRRNGSKFIQEKVLPADSISHIDHHPVMSNEKINRKLGDAVAHLEESGYYSYFKEVLSQSILDLELSFGQISAVPSKIVCLGLGHFSDCIIARYQLGLLVLLQSTFKASVELFDPVFTTQEKEILSSDLGFEVLPHNEEGKRLVNDLTIFYLPHCSHQLVNNLLFANWSPERLNSCVIISNSFVNIRETIPPRVLSASLAFISKAPEVCEEFEVVNSFQYSDIFNDTSIHVFPLRKLRSVPKNYWSDVESPVYTDLEFLPLSDNCEENKQHN